MLNALLAVDPGLVGLGWAAFDQDEKALLEAGLLERADAAKIVLELGPVVDRYRPAAVVIEIPQVYQQRQWKGDPNDLVTIAIIAGAIAALVVPAKTQLVKPHTWKGNRSKNVDNTFTKSLLSGTEMSALNASRIPRGKLHNVWDAVGIGLWALKRR